MAVIDLYSYRKKVAEGNVPDVFTYDVLPKGLRVQIAYIWDEALGAKNRDGWSVIHDDVAREHGLERLGGSHSTKYGQCREYLFKAGVDHALDIIEFSFRIANIVVPRLSVTDRKSHRIKVSPSAAIQELNERFKRAGVGYQFENGNIIRMDSELLHEEVVRPALLYLNTPGFEGPRDEYMSAHAHYRAGETKDAITDANNAFESTMKAICDKRKWTYLPGATATQLVKVVKDNGLLPDHLGRSFDQLAATLKSGLPQVRNEEGAHGQGSEERHTPDYVASYALHLAAAKILFLVEAHLATGA